MKRLAEGVVWCVLAAALMVERHKQRRKKR